MRGPLKYLMVLAALFAAGCSHFVKAPEFPEAEIAKDKAEAAYARVLQKFVNEKGQVDFENLLNQRVDLDRYVAFVAATPFSDFTEPQERLAHYLNAYNALSMFNVLESGIPKSNSGFGKVRFFFLTKFKIGRETMTLYSFETDVIRKVGDERVHFALNCMSVSCPKLPRVPFKGAGLGEVLDRAARDFFAEPRNLTVDPAEKTITVSRILKFYTDDFLKKAPTLPEYINRWREPPLPTGFKLKFYDYDWTLNNSTVK